MGKGIAIIKTCLPYLTSTTLRQVIQSFTLSHLQYSSVIWSSAAKKELNKLQLVQNRATRLALNCPSRTNVELLHKSLSWLVVEKKLKLSILMFFWNISKCKKPEFFSEHILYRSNLHHYRTHTACAGHLVLPRSRTNMLRRVIYRAQNGIHSLPKLCKWYMNTPFKRIWRGMLLAIWLEHGIRMYSSV